MKTCEKLKYNNDGLQGQLKTLVYSMFTLTNFKIKCNSNQTSL